MGSSEELEDRATQHQREIILLLDEVAFWHCVQVLLDHWHATIKDSLWLVH